MAIVSSNNVIVVENIDQFWITFVRKCEISSKLKFAEDLIVFTK